MTVRCKDPNARVVAEVEPAAVWALLDESYRRLKAWREWELPHQAREPLRRVVQNAPETAGAWLRVYRIEMSCQQAEALRLRSDELGDALQRLPDHLERDTGAALKRAARAFFEVIRLSRPVPR